MLAAGSRVGEYEIEGDLGEGGMAGVYRARHTTLDTVHALSVLRPHLRHEEGARQRFLDEARLQAKVLDHRGIVKVTDIVATDEHAAVVMELADGGSLVAARAAFVDRPDELKRLVGDVLDALGHAHAAGVVHRALEPASVLLHRKAGTLVPRLTGFGQRIHNDDHRYGDSVADPPRVSAYGYMSPEALGGGGTGDVTPRANVFSVGAMLYELATGAAPFAAESDVGVVSNIILGKLVDPATRRPGIDPVIAEVIRCALATDPGQRYGSCAEMATALRRTSPAVVQATAPAAQPRARVVPAASAAPGQLMSPRAQRTALQIGLLLGGIGAIAGLAAGGTYLVHYLGQPKLEKVRAPVAGDLARYREVLGLSGALKATIVTTHGTLVCDLFEDRAPLAVASFVGLATGLKPWRDGMTGEVQRGVSFYEHRAFHREVPAVAIQAGRAHAQPRRSSEVGYRFASEGQGAQIQGALTTVSDDEGRSGAELKILETEVAAPTGKDTVFGHCGPLDVIKTIARVARGGDEPTQTPVRIKTVAISAR